MRLRSLLLASLVLASVPAAEAGAQDVRDFRYAADITPALQFSNPAALAGWSGRMSVVELEGTKGNGSLIPLEGSPDDFSLSAGTESYFRMNGKLAFHGSLSWSLSQGRDMGGPVLIEPDAHPVGFLESDPSTTGIKKRERYGMEGALSWNPGPRWSLGAGISYRAGDQTKIKDPRFRNVLMDLDLGVGVAFRPSDALLLGLSLHYRDTQEQLRGGVYGTSDTQYFILADKGAFLGSSAELAGSHNYIPTDESRPMADRRYGLSLQALVRERFGNELSVRYRTGYYGKRSAASPVFFEYGGIEADYSGRLLLPSGGSSLHRVSLELGFASLANHENIFRYITPQGQATVVEYSGQNRILDRIDLSAALDYRWYGDAGGPRPGVTLGAKAGYEGRLQTTTLYPVWRKQAFHALSVDLYGQKVITNGPWSWIIDLSLSSLAGFGTERQDGRYATDASSNLKSFDEYLGRYYEHKTLPRAGVSAGFTAARRFRKGPGAYLRVSDSFLFLLSQPRYLAGRSRNLACISLGCNF